MTAPQIEWNDAPRNPDKTGQLDLERCDAKSLGWLTILSDKPLWNTIHWFNGRSTPHTRENCAACAAGRAGTEKGYLASYNPKTRRIAIAELTAPCHDEVAKWLNAHGTLRGASFKLTRPSGNIKGKLKLQIVQGEQGTLELPPCPDVMKALHFMWGTSLIPKAIAETAQRTEDERRAEIAARVEAEYEAENPPEMPPEKIELLTEEAKATLKRNKAASDAKMKAHVAKMKADQKARKEANGAK